MGITPADAGKTPVKQRERIQGEDHPRGCGENGEFENIFWGCLGSPPRMRGKQSFDAGVLR